MNTRTNYPAIAVAVSTLVLLVLIVAPLIVGVVHATHTAGAAL